MGSGPVGSRGAGGQSPQHPLPPSLHTLNIIMSIVNAIYYGNDMFICWSATITLVCVCFIFINL